MLLKMSDCQHLCLDLRLSCLQQTWFSEIYLTQIGLWLVSGIFLPLSPPIVASKRPQKRALAMDDGSVPLLLWVFIIGNGQKISTHQNGKGKTSPTSNSRSVWYIWLQKNNHPSNSSRARRLRWKKRITISIRWHQNLVPTRWPHDPILALFHTRPDLAWTQPMRTKKSRGGF